MRRVVDKLSKKMILLFLLIIVGAYFADATVIATEKTVEEAENELKGYINSQLSDIDFSELESLVASLDDAQSDIFGEAGFKSKILRILNGEFASSQSSIFSACINLLFSEAAKLIPLLATVVSIAILCSLLNGLKTGGKNNSSIVYFSCFGGVILIVSYVIFAAVSVVKGTVGLMQVQMQVVFPILLTIMTAIGGIQSVAVFQPITAIMSSIVVTVMTGIILPIFIISYVFNILSNLNPNINLSGFNKFLSSTSKWVIGITFTVFTAFMAVQGISAAVYDGVSIKTARYAISNYVPIVGGFLSDGFNLIMAGSVLIKNAVGVGSIVLLLSIVLVPIIQLAALKLALQLIGAVIEPLQDKGFAKFVMGASESLNILLAVLITVAFMFFIFLVLIICTANYLF